MAKRDIVPVLVRALTLGGKTEPIHVISSDAGTMLATSTLALRVFSREIALKILAKLSLLHTFDNTQGIYKSGQKISDTPIDIDDLFRHMYSKTLVQTYMSNLWIKIKSDKVGETALYNLGWHGRVFGIHAKYMDLYEHMKKESYTFSPMQVSPQFYDQEVIPIFFAGDFIQVYGVSSPRVATLSTPLLEKAVKAIYTERG